LFSFSTAHRFCLQIGQSSELLEKFGGSWSSGIGMMLDYVGWFIKSRGNFHPFPRGRSKFQMSFIPNQTITGVIFIANPNFPDAILVLQKVRLGRETTNVFVTSLGERLFHVFRLRGFCY
jgi:hypothetical protein